MGEIPEYSNRSQKAIDDPASMSPGREISRATASRYADQFQINTAGETLKIPANFRDIILLIGNLSFSISEI